MKFVVLFLLPAWLAIAPCAFGAPRDPGAREAEFGRIRIYQLLPRLFGNTNLTCAPNGSRERNGCGRFADLNDNALRSLRDLGITHVWLTGVHRQATRTEYPGLAADDPDIVKGSAGSPYAIRDYFDVCPDYATDPARRLEEFDALVARCTALGLRVILDFVPNHVARSYASVVAPEHDFGTRGRGGAGDDRSAFFHPDNNFFYLPSNGGPLRLPRQPDGDGLFQPETEFGRVTGNNLISWSPDANSWYETVKLNYGFNFRDGTAAYPAHPGVGDSVPDTWRKMDAVLAYWQARGVSGFRCDMAHMVPCAFWSWAIARAHARDRNVIFLAEAYKDDPARVPNGAANVLHALLDAGFDSVYDDDTYDIVKGVFDGPKWANDIDTHRGESAFARQALRYGENHDEVRLAHPKHWGGAGADVGRAVCGLLFGLSPGPVLLYHGQEVGEPALGAEGFGGDDARTSIFDYWCMPALARWNNGGRYDGGQLRPEEHSLREHYRRLLRIVGERAFDRGVFHGLNPVNQDNPRFGRLPGETASGHQLYAYLRADTRSDDRFLVVVNLHPTHAFSDVTIRIPDPALEAAGIPHGTATERAAAWTFEEVLATEGALRVTTTPADLAAPDRGLSLPAIPPLTAYYFRIQSPR
jgi:glycosidase